MTDASDTPQSLCWKNVREKIPVGNTCHPRQQTMIPAAPTCIPGDGTALHPALPGQIVLPPSH